MRDCDLFPVVMAACLCGLVCFFIGGCVAETDMKHKAVAHGAGTYVKEGNEIVFRWKDQK